MLNEEVENDQLDEDQESRLTNLGEMYGRKLSGIYETYSNNITEVESAQPGAFDRFLDSTRPTAPDLMAEADFIFRDKLVAVLAEKDITAAAEELPAMWEDSVQEAKAKKDK